MKIQAAVVREPSSPFVIEELELDEPRDDEIIVRIAGAGICHTDLSAREQYIPVPLPSVLGHEGSGIVEKTGAGVTKVKPGDHVVLSWDTCCKCPACREGDYTYCEEFLRYNFGGTRPDGTTTLSKGDQIIHGCFFGQSSFANYALVNERNIVKVRDDIPIEMLAPLGCGVLTGAGASINSLQVKPGSSIAVFGVGTVGISAILGALVMGSTTIIGVDIKDDRLEAAKSFGATHTVNSSEVDPVEAIRDITGGGAEYTLECVGNPQVFRQAVDSLPLRGVCGLIGAVAPGTEVTLNMDHIMNGRTVKGIIEGDAIPELFLPQLIELNQQGRFPFDKMIKYYPFDKINQAVEDVQSGGVIKAVLKF